LARGDLRAEVLRAEFFFFDLGDFFVGERIGCPQNLFYRGMITLRRPVTFDKSTPQHPCDLKFGWSAATMAKQNWRDKLQVTLAIEGLLCLKTSMKKRFA